MQKPYIVVFAYGKFVLCTNSQMLERHNKRKPMSGRMEDFMKYEVIYKTSTSFVVELKENGHFSSETEHEIYFYIHYCCNFILSIYRAPTTFV